MMLLLVAVYFLIIMWPGTIVAILCSACCQAYLARRWLRQRRKAFAAVVCSVSLQLLVPLLVVAVVRSIHLTPVMEQMCLPPELVTVVSIALFAEIVLFALSAGCLISARIKRGRSQPSPASDVATRTAHED